MGGLVAGVTLLATLAVAPVPAAGCERSFAVVGRACAVRGGFLTDGGLFTHGPDAPPGHATGAVPPPAVPVSCVGDTSFEPHGLAIYFRTIDAPDLYATRAPDIQTMIEVATGKLVEEAAPHGVDIRFRMACTAGRPTVVAVTGTTPRSATTFTTIMSDLKALGHADTHQKYWIWVEGPRGLGGAAGIGTWNSNDSMYPTNSNNVGPSYSATFGYTNAEGGWTIMLHEASHNLGAVQNTAPFSSGAAHCNDGHDIMCYADGGPKSSYTTTRCPTWFAYDCGGNDYFNPRPAPSNYLARKWNIASPVDRFVAGCAYGVARLLPTISLEVDVTGCGGAPYSAAGFLPPRDTSAVPADIAEPLLLDVDVCFSAGTTSLGCATTFNQPERGTVPAGATRAVVSLGSAPAADAVFNAI